MKANDLRGHIEALDKAGLLVRVKREINKDTEIHPLVRWQYRGGIPEEARKAFLFDNVVDGKGKKYPGQSVVVGVHAASKYVYAIGLGCKPEEINAKWEYAFANRIEPVIVPGGPVHEVVRMGKELAVDGGGTDAFPIPISTPGFDNAPYATCANWISKDPDTGIANAGNYRAQVKGRTKVGICLTGLGQDLLLHWKKCKEKGRRFSQRVKFS